MSTSTWENTPIPKASDIPAWVVNPAYRPAINSTRDKMVFVSFGHVARDICRDQCQYISRYLDGAQGWSTDYPVLGTGLRWVGKTEDYHFLEIEWSSALEFVFRYAAWRYLKGCISLEDADAMIAKVLEADPYDFT